MTRLGWILVEQGDTEEGIAKILNNLDTQHSPGAELTHCSDLVILAQAYLKSRQAEEGLKVAAEALEIVEHNAIRHYEPELYRLKGELLLQICLKGLESDVSLSSSTLDSSSVEEAETCFQQAITLAAQRRAKLLELRATMSLSRLWQLQGNHAAARQKLEEIYNWFTEGFDTLDLLEAKALLEALK